MLQEYAVCGDAAQEKAFGSIEESPLEDIHAEETGEGLREHGPRARSASVAKQLLSPELGIALEPAISLLCVGDEKLTASGKRLAVRPQVARKVSGRNVAIDGAGVDCFGQLTRAFASEDDGLRKRS